VKDINPHIVRSAIARNPFYTFANIKKYFPNLESMREFATSEKYLGGLEITFKGNVYQLEENKVEKLNAMLDLLGEIEGEVRQQNTRYEGSKDFQHSRVHEVFTDKLLKFSKDNERGKEDSQFEHEVKTKDWFAFNTIYGTSEEKAFVRMLDRQMEKLKEQYESIYLLRNEGHFAIYNFSDGRAFQPDFVLFLRQKNGELLTYQLFIEPKGKHLTEKDRWKENFLKEIKQEFGNKVLKLEESKYRLIGVPFYNNEEENVFRENLESALN
jgi:type III restriction enzyme